MIRRLNVPVPSETVLSEMSERGRILGMRTTKRSYQLLRETYFDTPDGALRARGLILRLRSEARGRDSLVLTVKGSVSLQGVTEEVELLTPVIEGGLYATLQGQSEVASRVREVAQADALRPLAAMDIDREIRDLRPGLFGRPSHRLEIDTLVAHVPDASRALLAATITEIGRGKVSLETLGSRLRGEFGTESDGMDTLERVHEALLAPKGAPRPESPADVRVGLLLLRDWDVALVEGGAGLTIPTARGSGEEIARDFLAELGSAAQGNGELDLVGFANARRGGSDLEVWIHQASGTAREEGLIWIPLTELMERIGGPRLRDPGLVATLLMLVRTDLGGRLLREAPLRHTPPKPLPLAERSEVKVGKDVDDYIDLELSILDFNQRVLELAEDPSIPLLERIRFVSIFSSNMDEFFVVRVGRMKDEVSDGGEADDSEFSPEALLDMVAVRARALFSRQYKVFDEVLLPELAARGSRILSWAALTDGQRAALSERFQHEIFPLLTPQGMTSGPGRSFPRVVSLALGLVAVLRRGDEERSEYGYIPVPEDVDRLFRVPDSADVIPIEEVIGANAHALFPSAELHGVYSFRPSRLGDVDIDEDSAGSLLSAVADEVESRPFKPVVRVEVESRMPRELRAYLYKELRGSQPTDGPTITRSDMVDVDGLLDLRAAAELCDLPIEGGVFPSHTPEEPLDPDRSIFDILADGDVLCHHPFQAFDATVGRFLHEAATDPDVVGIKLTLYRTGKRSPVMDALLKALEAGKDVSVFVELKARFDEESNIEWTHRLRDAGASVVYGVVGYKTHAKTALVIRKEAGGIRRYVHIGTGNYNAATARFYTDFGLMSADPDLGADLNDFFNELTGGAGPPQKEFRRLLVAPNSLVQGTVRMIKREIDHAKAGRRARIQVKVNGLADRKVVKALYKAAQKGVEVDLIVRSICTLRPGVPGLSEGIRVRSILGRFLEHSRIYYFENAGESEYYIGSADWRARNLRRRVEVVTPVDDPGARAVLRAVLDAQLVDPRAWVLRPDGAFERLRGEGPSSQEAFLPDAAAG